MLCCKQMRVKHFPLPEALWFFWGSCLVICYWSVLLKHTTTRDARGLSPVKAAALFLGSIFWNCLKCAINCNSEQFKWISVKKRVSFYVKMCMMTTFFVLFSKGKMLRGILGETLPYQRKICQRYLNHCSHHLDLITFCYLNKLTHTVNKWISLPLTALVSCFLHKLCRIMKNRSCMDWTGK